MRAHIMRFLMVLVNLLVLLRHRENRICIFGGGAKSAKLWWAFMGCWIDPRYSFFIYIRSFQIHSSFWGSFRQNFTFEKLPNWKSLEALSLLACAPTKLQTNWTSTMFEIARAHRMRSIKIFWFMSIGFF